MDNATRKELLYRARAAGYPGSILDVYANYDQGKDLIAEFQDQQRQQQMSQMAAQQSGLQQSAQGGQPQIEMQPQPVAMPAVPSFPTPAPKFTPPQPPQPIGVQSQETPVGIVSGQTGPNQARPIFKTGGFKYDEGGPIKGFDLSKSMAENLELNRRARVAGWNSVEEYEKAKWGYNTVKQKQQELINNPEAQKFAKPVENKDQLSANKTSGAQKAVNQAYNVLSNPVEAAGHAMKYGYVPQGNLGNYGHRGDGDAFATTINDFVNPFAWGNAAYRFSKDVTNKDSYTTGMGALNMGADLAESLPFFGAAAKTMAPAVKAAAHHPLINGLHDVMNSPNEFGTIYKRALAFKTLNSLASPLGVPLYKLPGINNMYKGAAYKVASMSSKADRSMNEVIEGLTPGAKLGKYDGYMGTNLARENLVRQYIYGDGNMTKSDIPSRGLKKYTKKYGPLDTFKLQTDKEGWGVRDIEFNDIKPLGLPGENWSNMNPKLKNLDFIKNPFQQRKALEKILKREGTIALSKNHSRYSDVNIGGHNVFLNYDPATGKITAQTQDIWKFTPDDYSAKWVKGADKLDLSRYAVHQQAKLMDRSGKPFILQDLRDFDLGYDQSVPIYKKDIQRLKAKAEKAARPKTSIPEESEAKYLPFDYDEFDLSEKELDEIRAGISKKYSPVSKSKKLGGVKCYTCVGRKRRV